jgi:hypothetical protein
MAWFKVDDRFWSHPVTSELSDSATALWIRAGSWSAMHLTDGMIPKTKLRTFRSRKRAADELVEVGLWIDNGGEYEVANWCKYQPSKSEIEAKREATRERVESYRKGKLANSQPEASQKLANSQPENTQKSDADFGNENPQITGEANDCNSVSNGVGNTTPVPSRPLSNKLSSEEELSDVDDYSDDVKELCDYLANKVKENRYRVGVVGVTWFRAADRLLRVDKVSVAEAKQVIDWCQQNEFWQGNIKSMSKFREKYDTLTSQMRRDRKMVDKSKRDPNVIDFHDKPGWGFRNYEGEQK